MILTLLPALLLSAVGLVATWTDITARRVPNWVTLGGLVAFLGLAAWQGSLPAALLGALLAFSVLLLAKVLGGGIGGGDLKYAAAIGAALGPRGGLLALLIAAVLGVAVGLAVVVVGGLFSGQSFLVGLRRDPSRPFAPILAVSSLLALNLAPTWTWLWQVGRWTP